MQQPESIHQFIRLCACTASPAHSESQGRWRQWQLSSGKDWLDQRQFIRGQRERERDRGRGREGGRERENPTALTKTKKERKTSNCLAVSPLTNVQCFLNIMMAPKTNFHSAWQIRQSKVYISTLHASTRSHSSQFKKIYKYVYASLDMPISQSTIKQVMALTCLRVQLK